MTNENARLSALRKLVDDDAVGQLRRRDGLMATLGNEDGALNLDWVEVVARLLADPAAQNEIVRKIAEAKQASWGAIPLHFCMPRR